MSAWRPVWSNASQERRGHDKTERKVVPSLAPRLGLDIHLDMIHVLFQVGAIRRLGGTNETKVAESYAEFASVPQLRPLLAAARGRDGLPRLLLKVLDRASQEGSRAFQSRADAGWRARC